MENAKSKIKYIFEDSDDDNIISKKKLNKENIEERTQNLSERIKQITSPYSTNVNSHDNKKINDLFDNKVSENNANNLFQSNNINNQSCNIQFKNDLLSNNNLFGNINNIKKKAFFLDDDDDEDFNLISKNKNINNQNTNKKTEINLNNQNMNNILDTQTINTNLPKIMTAEQINQPLNIFQENQNKSDLTTIMPQPEEKVNIEDKNLKRDNSEQKEILPQNDSNELNKLKSELDKYKTENEKLKSELDKYQKENEKVKSDLFKANKIISGFQNNQISNNELKSLRDENNKLIYELTIKENEIKDLKNKLLNNSSEELKVNYKDIMVITFISQDSTVQYGIKCLPTDIFAEVEEKLYQKYDNLRDTNNMFTANAKTVLRFKKICENNIKDGDICQLFKLE